MTEIMISPRRVGKIKVNQGRGIVFSRIEIGDLLKAWIAISIAFGILLSGFSSLINFGKMFIVSLFTVGTGFLFHELAHKITAQHYGCLAEFRAFNPMLLLAIFMSFFGFVFAAPGAVMIRGVMNREQNGKISLAGPLTNIILALIFLIIFKATSFGIAQIGFTINAYLAVFNMLPFGFFDGAKVFRWNKTVFGVAIGIPIALMILNSFI
jgi:Zn-dependent protease